MEGALIRGVNPMEISSMQYNNAATWTHRPVDLTSQVHLVMKTLPESSRATHTYLKIE